MQKEAHPVLGARLRLHLSAAGAQAASLQGAPCSRVSRGDLTRGMVQKEAHVVLAAFLRLHLSAAGAQAAALQSTEERAPRFGALGGLLDDALGGLGELSACTMSSSARLPRPKV